MIPTVLSWSGGKDCCMALFEFQRGGLHDVVALLTTYNRDDDRIPVHGVHRDLVACQAEALGLPIEFLPLPPTASNVAYEGALEGALARHRSNGVEAIAFGDLHLADIRNYRVRLVERTGLVPLFPVWGRAPQSFAADIIEAGFRAFVVSVDRAALDDSFIGRTFDATFVADLPASVDPCGENGEFHTFVFDGPNFANAVDVQIGPPGEPDSIL